VARAAGAVAADDKMVIQSRSQSYLPGRETAGPTTIAGTTRVFKLFDPQWVLLTWLAFLGWLGFEVRMKLNGEKERMETSSLKRVRGRKHRQ